MKNRFVPIILAGGRGERFWPLSRRDRPKQFLRILPGGQSLLEATAERLLPLAGGWDGLWVVTSEDLREGIHEHLPHLPTANLLVEPEGRDTAPAVAWAALEVARRWGEDAVLAFFPADHWIGDVAAFHRTLQAGVRLATRRDGIVTLGVEPTHPATGYGYIERGEPVGSYQGFAAYRVARFTEKPDPETARAYLETGRYAWNSGIFIFRAGVILQEFRAHAPEILEPLERLGQDAYPTLPRKSVDYAVMEHTRAAYVIPARFGWDDLGDWTALERLLQGEHPGTRLARHIGLDTEGAFVYATREDELIVTIGLENVVIVRDGKITLVVRKDQVQKIKKVLKSIKDDPELRELL
ncbi:mannose-1-phosphate guanylyltransferase [Marinithermus hydrothermalis]|uniref:Mannose-1-phosphate guanylyltransferase n=1 Tax=Marinithermus hydrothermalis (strain DSM 14884 / JCM 11576 / T1) TaxID=869210 RepID=F2NL78_MARHT|nr:mannose-1-phosphate guanylyltransferase [Marinithermus hydrothermalis]AEB11481.1 Mannose-1-phosphate guanylyltransferase [Marinithermus hydrothermalis DSM 14884]